MAATEQQAGKQVKAATFVARKRNLTLVRQPMIQTPLLDGRLITSQEGVRYKFGEGTPPGQIVKRAGEDMMADGPLDENFNPTQQDAIQWLRSHRLYNSEFSEVGNEIDRPQPTEEEFMGELTDAAMALDLETVDRLLERERATHNRSLLVQAAERAQGKLAEAADAMAAKS